MGKYRDLGRDRMPIAFVFGVPPAYEIMANFSGLHMDAWGELEMVGTIMQRDVEVVPCETLELNVPAEAEIVVEGHVNLKERFKVGEVTSPSMYNLPHYENLPEVEITAITMRGDRPIYRNHQTCPDTDHQPLPRLCHEAVSTTAERDRPASRTCAQSGRRALLHLQLTTRARAWSTTRSAGDGGALAQHQARGRGIAGHHSRRSRRCYHAIATRCDPARRHHGPEHAGIAVRPSARPLDGHYPEVVGKMGIDATVKARHDPADFERAWPRNWGKVKLSDYL
jgi:3-polyprenyl-4-hydroxybenzoate decarboxylase